MSEIKEFYSGKTIFVTGATGFLGKTLVEKLLRSCDDIHCIYILIRNKKSKSAKERANEYTSDPIFEFNGLKQSGICNKIEPIFGDILEPNLGIGEEDRQKLIRTVNVVIHLAASVKLNGTLRFAIERNVKPIPHLIELCHQMERLDCLVYASTVALLNGTDNASEVVPQDMTVSPDFIFNYCDKHSDKELKKLQKFLFFEYSNTYCISKALAEQLLLRESTRLKIAIVRPSIVLSSYKEPTPGWVQGLQSSVSAGILVGLGLMKIFPIRADGAQCVIPVDYVTNAIIASSWSVSKYKEPNLQVYNLTTQSGQSPSMRIIMRLIKKNAIKYPSKRVVRPPSLTFARNDLELRLEGYIKHWFFAYFIDLMAKIVGIPTKIVSITNHMNDNMKDIIVFMKTSPEYEITNTLGLIDQMSETDKELFNFDIRTIDWKLYCKNMWLGARRHILKERDQEIKRARKILKWVFFKYHILNMCWLTFLSIIFYFVFYFSFLFLGYDFYQLWIPLIGPAILLIISLIFGYKLLNFILL